MADQHDVVPRSAARHTEGPGGRSVVLVLTFLFVLAAVSVSTGLVVYTAWRHNLTDGLFALAFAVLSARAALSWCLWHHGSQPQLSAVSKTARGESARTR